MSIGESFEVVCAVCGQPVEPDPDARVMPDGAVICGECFRAREFDEILWESKESKES